MFVIKYVIYYAAEFSNKFFFTVKIALENYLFLFFYSVKLIPTIYEMVWTYKTKPDNEVMPWPTWVACITNVSHFLLTFVCSANFFIYYAKHGSLCKSRKAKKRNDLASPTHTQWVKAKCVYKKRQRFFLREKRRNDCLCLRL